MTEPLPPEAYARVGMPHSRLRAVFCDDWLPFLTMVSP
jgi:hypothetical protein